MKYAFGFALLFCTLLSSPVFAQVIHCSSTDHDTVMTLAASPWDGKNARVFVTVTTKEGKLLREDSNGFFDNSPYVIGARFDSDPANFEFYEKIVLTTDLSSAKVIRFVPSFKGPRVLHTDYYECSDTK